MSRLCDRVTRRASPGLDTDLSGLGLGFIYPGGIGVPVPKSGFAPKTNSVSSL